jgi:aspartate-semialdehyde dehydrogenase
VLKTRGFPVSSVHAFASEKSAGKPITAGGFEGLVAEPFSLEAARKMDVVFLAVDGAFAKDWAEKICAGDGPYVIDNSSQFRYDSKYPLVVPEINGAKIKTAKLIANPNCTTAICLSTYHPPSFH